MCCRGTLKCPPRLGEYGTPSRCPCDVTLLHSTIDGLKPEHFPTCLCCLASHCQAVSVTSENTRAERDYRSYHQPIQFRDRETERLNDLVVSQRMLLAET